MKKLLSFILVLCFSANVFAGSTLGLERAMDEYQFALTVEWDQKDEAQYQKMNAAFFAEVAKLVAAEGLSQADVLTVAEKKMANKAQLEALKLKLTLAGKAQSKEALGQILQESVKDMYAQGASWNGDAVVPILAGLAVAAIIGYAIWFHANHRCVAWDERWECSATSYCDDWGYCYTDESCGWETYCTRYEKK